MGVHARASVERRNRETRETRAAAFQSRAWSFACLGRFAQADQEKRETARSLIPLKSVNVFPQACVSQL